MKRTKRIAAFVVALAAGAANAEMTVENFKLGRNARDGSPVSDLYKTYMNGVVEGITWTNSMSEEWNGKAGYCPPRKLAITGAMLSDMIAQYLRDNGAWNTNKVDKYAVSLVALHTLRDTYPCE